MKTNAPRNADPRRCQHNAAPSIFEATGKSLSVVIFAVAWGFIVVAISGYLYFDEKKYFEHLWTNPDAHLILSLGLGLGLGICGLIISGILIAIIQEQLRIARELEREVITACKRVTTASDCIYLAEVTEDARFRYLETNRAFEALMGMPEDGMRRKYIGDLLWSSGAEAMADRVIAKFRRCQEANSVENGV